MTTIEARYLTANSRAMWPSCGCPARRIAGFIEGMVALAVIHECSAKRAAKTFTQFVPPEYPVLCDPLADALAQAF